MAALFVAFYHASVYAERQLGDAGWTGAFDGRFGGIGVSIFFAISGVLMADLIQKTDPWRFLAHRIVRIYPTYLLAAAVTVLILGLLGVRKFGLHAFSLLLVPAGERSYYLGVEWTLIFECTYYLALFLIALAGLQRHLNVIALGWLGMLGVASLSTGPDSSAVLYPAYSILFSPANVAFARGLLIPWINPNVRLPLGVGIAACCIFMLIPPANIMIARWAAGVAAALLIVDAMRLKIPSRAATFLLTAGDRSYALYLVHVPCIFVVYHFWPTSLRPEGAWLFAVTTAIAVSSGFGMIDVQLYRYLRNATDNLDEDSCRRRVNIYVGAFIAASLIAILIP
jgi:peptidoglycan/LPS O-acetylase OafA/YrhL